MTNSANGGIDRDAAEVSGNLVMGGESSAVTSRQLYCVSRSSPLGAADHVHQFCNLAALVGLVAGRDGVLDAMRDMIAQDFLLDPAQRGARRRDLSHHVDAITVILDHAGKTADLALDPVQPFQ